MVKRKSATARMEEEFREASEEMSPADNDARYEAELQGIYFESAEDFLKWKELQGQQFVSHQTWEHNYSRNVDIPKGFLGLNRELMVGSSHGQNTAPAAQGILADANPAPTSNTGSDQLQPLGTLSTEGKIKQYEYQIQEIYRGKAGEAQASVIGVILASKNQTRLRTSNIGSRQHPQRPPINSAG